MVLFCKEGLLAALCLGLVACASGSPDRCRMARATDIPLRFAIGHLLAAPLLNDQPTNMILDTGAQTTALTREAAERLSLALVPLPGTLDGIGGSRSVYGFQARTYQIGTLRGRDFQLLASDMTLSSPGMTVDGLLGADFLAAYDLDLDLPEHKATLYAVLHGCTRPSTALDGSLYVVPFARVSASDPRAHVRVGIGGKTLIAAIDSGATGTVIFRDSARRLGLQIDQLSTDRHFHATGVGPRARDAVRHVMAPITIGDLTIQNLPVAIIDQRSLPDADMLIGLDFLFRVHAWLSFSSHSLILQFPPRPSPAAR